MKKEKIEESLREKYDDEFTIKMFTNFALEFQLCFANSMTTEELLTRIKKNVIGNIKIKKEFDNKTMDGQYDDEGYICLKESAIKNERYIRYLLFHEMLHAITSVRDKNGNEVMLGFSYLKNGYGKGLNEAMTEHLTQIRNQKMEENYGDLISNYRTVVGQIRRLILITGDEELQKCYFYNPDGLKNLLTQSGMDYNEVEMAYRYLCNQDYDVHKIQDGRKLGDNQHYQLSRFAEKLFDNYSKSIGEVNTLEDFKKKYKIFETCVNTEFDCIKIMNIKYYNKMGEDIERLVSKGISLSEIKDVLQNLGINLNTLIRTYKFSKCFHNDKNQSAIDIYEYYKKNPKQYINFFANNYGTIFEHFSELGEWALNPSDEQLYSYFSYPLKGLLLKEHPELDYSEISYYHIQDEYTKLNVFIFTSADGKKYGYSTNGDKAIEYFDEEGNQVLRFSIDEKITFMVQYQTNGKITTAWQGEKEADLRNVMENCNIQAKYSYSDKEEVEYWLQECNDELAQRKLDNILERTKDRREKCAKALE